MDGLYRYDFEKPLAELGRRLRDARKERMPNPEAIQALEQQLDTLKRQVYADLTPWQRVQLARHPLRPYTLDYIRLMTSDFVELHGDRLFGDDKALVGGLATLDGQRVMVFGHQKGRDTKEILKRNFGSAHPEGYRKALRFMRLAEKMRLPVVVLIDTPGAYPGIGAEERGQAHSIAYNMREMARIKTPIFLCVIGEGGSGGALGVGVGDYVTMLENSYYSVISPEGCAAILWRDRAKSPEAAAALKMTAPDLLKLELVDEAIPEPLGGAHHAPPEVAERLKQAILEFIKRSRSVKLDALLARRYERFRKIGAFTTEPVVSSTRASSNPPAAPSAPAS
ncbi:MAG: acetyl-CoA carboxylase carboxyltransferase subunit alpha [Candidatus Omnitrophica bacterium]|nr:acetyl-CoA carboxylase carboxyltransferase subunit alpha [Candidatus Omnitrophota bacterium]